MRVVSTVGASGTRDYVLSTTAPEERLKDIAMNSIVGRRLFQRPRLFKISLTSALFPRSAS